MRLLLALVLLAPAASAASGCLASACLDDEAMGSPTCDQHGQFGFAHTTARAGVGDAAEAHLTGYDQCVHADSGRYRQHGVAAGATAGGQSAHVAWYESTESGPHGSARFCTASVSVGTSALSEGRFLGCPADKAPPNPGWGRLLP